MDVVQCMLRQLDNLKLIAMLLIFPAASNWGPLIKARSAHVTTFCPTEELALERNEIMLGVSIEITSWTKLEKYNVFSCGKILPNK